MKHFHPFLYLLLGAAFIAHVACNDPTVIGEDLLSGDQLDIEFTDTLTLLTYNAKEDSVRTFNPDIFATNYTSFPIGDFNDPVFGRTRASAVFQVSLLGSSPVFSSGTLDSIVLILPYRANQTYGKLDEEYTIEVLELSQSLDDSLEYFSNDSFESFPFPIGSRSFYPAPEDSVSVFSPKDDDFVQEAPHLRVRLDNAFSDAFFSADATNFESVDAFLDFFKGIMVRPASENGGLVSFNFGLSTTGLRVYYHVDTVFSEYFFPVNSATVVAAKFENDYTGATVNDFLGETSPYADSLLFLQGMSGINIVLEIPYADELTNIIVNKAELELPIIWLPNDDPDYSPIDQIVVSQVLADGSLRLIDDITRSPASRLTEIFGGVVSADDVYRLNISAHFQDMIRSLVTNKLRITAYIKPEQAGRVVLGGPGNRDYPAKLNLTYTRF